MQLYGDKSIIKKESYLQVFTPYFSIDLNVNCLDNKRKNKQILEIIQIILANNNIQDVWKIPKYVYNHPNTLLWKNKETYLLMYLSKLLNDFHNRANKIHKCHCFDEFLCIRVFKVKFNKIINNYDWVSCMPEHLTLEKCKEHRNLLLSKDPEHYVKYF